MKNKKIEKIYGDPKKLSSYENAVKLGSSYQILRELHAFAEKKFKKPKL